jgi:hypothetical protein
MYLTSIASIIGSVLIGYGFLSVTSVTVPQSLIITGAVLFLFALFAEELAPFPFKKQLKMIGLLALLAAIPIGLAFRSGAESLGEAIVQVQLSFQLFFLILGLIAIHLSFLYKLVFADPLSTDDVGLPANDWSEKVDKEYSILYQE